MDNILINGRMSREDVAAFLKMSSATVNRLAKSGILKPIKDGGRLSFERSHIESFIKPNSLNNSNPS